jgi:hypothetical protein
VNRRAQRALTSLIAIFGMLAVVCLSSTNLQATAAPELQSHAQAHHLYCSGPSSAASYLSQLKPRFTAFVATGAMLSGSLLQDCHHAARHDVDAQLIASTYAARPLWLINRSLLI